MDHGGSRLRDGVAQNTEVDRVTLDEVSGPQRHTRSGDIEAVLRGLKDDLAGEIDVAGPDLAQSLTELSLIDEYPLYFHPVVLGHGKPFFAGPRPPLRLVANDLIGEDTIRLTYVPA